MKKKSYKLLLVSIIFLFGYNISNAQFSLNNSEKTAFMYAVGGGASVVTASSYSLTGGNISFEIRKPFHTLGKNSNFSANLLLAANMGTERKDGEDKFGFMPTGLLSLNFNSHSQSSLAAKNSFGGFLGVGLLFVPSMKIESEDYDGNIISEETGMFGPAVTFGPRFKLGDSFLDLRFYGGVTFGEKDMTYGGVNVMFTLGMGKKKRHSMR